MDVYRFRVVIAGISPLIWRRLEVAATTTVAGLHAIVQAVFGWSGEHQHRFVIGGAEYGISCLGGPGFRDDARRVRLAGLGLREGGRFIYEYNFPRPGAWTYASSGLPVPIGLFINMRSFPGTRLSFPVRHARTS